MTNDSTLSSESLSEFVEYAESVAERYPQMDEENTKWKLVHRLLELLGWDVAFDTELEYSITIGSSSTYHVDYALFTSSSSPALFVETKGYDTTLTDNHRDQLYSYLRQTDVNWGLLTNGRSYEICRREIVDNGVQIHTLAEFDLEELPQFVDHVRLLSKEWLESGQSQENFERIIELRNAKQIFQHEKEPLAESLAGILTEAAGEAISQEAKRESTELIDRLVDRLDRRTESHQDEQPTDDSKINERTEPFWDEIERTIGIIRTEDSIELADDRSAKDNYVMFVSYLFEEGYLSRDDLPFGTGRKRYILNSEKKHKYGDDMYNPEEIVADVFLETHNNTEFKKRQIMKIGKMVRERLS
jgi:hypothetical protein